MVNRTSRVIGSLSVFVLLFVTVLYSHSSFAQVSTCVVPPANALLNTFNSANTCGVFTNVPVAERWSFGLIDIRDAVTDSLADPDGDGTGGVADRDNVTATSAMFHNAGWTFTNLGSLFGTTINKETGDMFATASANFGSAYFGQTAILNYGALGGGENATGAGAVYRMDAITGNPSLFATLPQQSTTITNLNCEARAFFSTLPDVTRTNVGVGLGNIVHDSDRDQFFISNWEDGRIYRLDNTGAILDAYDPDLTDDGSAGFANGIVPYGLAISPDGTRLFYGTMTRQIFSLDLTPTGGFTGSSSSVTLAGQTFDSFENATETLHTTIPDDTANVSIVTWVSDLEFDNNDTLMVGMRSGCNVTAGSANTTGNFASSYNHDAHPYTLDANGSGIYNTNLTEMRISYDSTTNAGTQDGNDTYGGVTYYRRPDSTMDYVVSSSDILAEAGPQGIAVFREADVSTSTALISPLAAISYFTDSTAAAQDAKGVGGDVDVLNAAICPVVGSIQGNVSQDTSGNGIGDVNLSGVTLNLFLDADGDGLADGPSIANTVTDGSGNYSFDNLIANNYIVVESQPAGLTDVSENEGGDDNDQVAATAINTISAVVSPGEADTGNDFVEEAFGSWTGNVSEDTDDNGSGDVAIAGVTITLYEDTNGDGILSAAEISAQPGAPTDTTDGSGDYSFTDLVPGDYIAVETQPTNFDDVSENEGGADNDDTNNPADNNQIAGTVTAGETDANNDFVEELSRGAITGNVSEDTDGNGTADVAIPGVVITLYEDTNGDGVLSAAEISAQPGAPTDTTDASGNYSFTDLAPGNYILVETQPAGYVDVSENEGGGDNDVATNPADNNQIAAIVSTGETDVQNDFIEEAVGSWTGNVSEDTDDNGSGDAAIPGVTITLYEDTNGDGILSAAEISAQPGAPTDTTDASGNYSFTNLAPGDYIAVETQPANFDDVSENEGGADNDDTNNPADNNQIAGTVTAGEADANNDFVEELSRGAITGNVSEDTDGNGTADVAIPGVTITLYEDTNGDGVLSAAEISAQPGAATDTTDASGNYSFTDLAPGDYILVETQPAGYVDVSENEGGADNDVATNPADNNQIAAIVSTGETDVQNDFIEEAVGSWTGNVSEDTDGNGTADVAISGVTITLYEDTNGDGVLSAAEISAQPGAPTDTTDGSGDYSFTNLAPGDYIAVETQPAGYVDVSENEGGVDNDDTNNPADNNQIAGTVTAGETDANNDFVEEAVGSWTGNVSEDTDDNGSGDIAIPGVTITLYEDTNGDGILSAAEISAQPGAPTDTTDASGNYSFTNLTPGDYIAVETQPANFDDVSENEGGADNDDTNNPADNNQIAGTVTAGETDVNNDFVEELSRGAITGNVSEDTDGNGTADVAIPGVTITLYEDTNGDGVLSAAEISAQPGAPTDTTDASGNYSFTDLAPGDYILVETQPAGYVDVSENEGGADNDVATNPADNNQIAAIVSTGETDVQNDFIEEAVGSWSGNVSEDTDNNGTADVAISGVTITLYEDTNGDGVLSAAEISAQPGAPTDTTDGSGDYSFTNLAPGDYIAVETQPVGFDDVSENEGGADNDDTNNPADNNQIAGTVTAGEADVNNDFIEELTRGSITGNVSEDTDGNGTADIAIPGVTITLYEDTNGDGILSAAEISAQPSAPTDTTDASGNYSFTDLAPGNYILVETQPAGYVDVSENEGGADNDVATNPVDNNQIAAIIAVGETDVQNDFIEEAVGSWTGNVSEDTDDNDTGDIAIPGVTITLYEDTNGDGILSAAEISAQPGAPTDTTDASGNYSFTNLTPGDYIAVETQPANFDDVSENEGGADNDDTNNPADNNQIAGTVTAGETDANNDFVEELTRGSITGNVSEDTDGNGTADVAIPGVTITLYEDTNGDGVLSAAEISAQPSAPTDTTDASGNYSFTDLAPGDYILVETQPAGYVDVSENEGGGDNDVATNPADNNQIAAIVGVGETDVQNDFIEEAVGSWTGNVSEDTTGNGSGDVAIAGVTITLYEDTNGDGVLSAAEISAQPGAPTDTTDGSGDYSFTDLAPGDYIAVETQPANFDDITENEGGADNDDANNPVVGNNQIAGTVTAGEADVNNDFVEGVPAIKLIKSISGVNDVNTNSITDAFDTIDYTFTVSNEGVTDLSNITITDAKLGLSAAPCAPGVIAQGGADISCTFTAAYTIQPGDVLAGYVVNSATTNANSASPVDATPGTPVTDVSDAGTEPSTPGTVTPVPDPDNTETPDPDPLIPDDDGDDGDDPTTLTLVQTGAISGNVSEDTTGDNNGDTPIPGVILTLYEDTDGDGVLSAAEISAQPGAPTDTTDGSGNYLFDNLAFGNYIVVETQPAGLEDVSEVEGGDDGDDNGNAADNNQISVVVDATDPEVGASTNEDTGNDFVEAQPGSIGDTVYLDWDADGVQDAGEPGIGGVQVVLRLNGVIVASMTTAADGTYLFGGLPAGNYTVTVTPPTGSTLSADGTYFNSGDPDTATDHNTATYGDNTSAYSLVNAENNLTQDFGYHPVIVADDDVAATPTVGPNVPDECSVISFLPGGGSDANLSTTFESILTNDIIAGPLSPAPAATTLVDLDPTTPVIDTTFVVSGEGTWDYNPATDVLTFTPEQFGIQQCFEGSPTPLDYRLFELVDINDDGNPVPVPEYADPAVLSFSRVTTPVNISFVEVERGVSGNAIIRWVTDMETANVGFDLYQRTEQGWERLNAELIPSAVFDSTEQSRYEFNAVGLVSDWIAIADVDANENVTAHGPYRVGEKYGADKANVQGVDWTQIKADSDAGLDVDTINKRIQRLRGAR